MQDAVEVVEGVLSISRSLQQAADEGRTADLDALLDRRQEKLQALQAMIADGLRLDQGDIAPRWAAVLEQDLRTEAAMTSAMDRLRASLKQIRMKRRTANAYRPTNGTGPSMYCDTRG